VSQENVEIVRSGYERFAATGQFAGDIVTPDFVWDMSKFAGWPESPYYTGVEGARRFLREWTEPFDDWQLEVETLHDAGDEVVAVLRQRARSKLTGMPVDMHFAQVWTIRDGKRMRVTLYAEPAEALKAVGPEE